MIIASLDGVVDGQTYHWTEAQIFGFRDGQICEFWGVPDASGAAAALSLAGAQTLEE